MSRWMSALAWSGVLCFMPWPLVAQPAQPSGMVVLESVIQGNQEQPNVIYLLPWQGPAAVDGLQPPLVRKAGDRAVLMEREEFQRELGYRSELPTALEDK